MGIATPLFSDYILTLSCLICNLEKSICGLFLRMSESSSVPNMWTGVMVADPGDLLRGVTGPSACSAASASFTVSGVREGVGIWWARAVSSNSCIYANNMNYKLRERSARKTINNQSVSK